MIEKASNMHEILKSYTWKIHWLIYLYLYFCLVKVNQLNLILFDITKPMITLQKFLPF
jgi:hypothetical protein